MSKYFKEREERKIISADDYIKSLPDYYKHDAEKYYAHLMEKVFEGSVFTKEEFKMFCDYYRSTIGYDVKRKAKTISYLYYMITKYGLSKEGFDQIASIYTEELFVGRNLEQILDKLIMTFGKTDLMFEGFMAFASAQAKELDEFYEKESEKLDYLTEEYGESFVKYLKHRIKRTHIKADVLIAALPTSELIKRDEEQRLELSYKTGIFMGLGTHASYKYIEEYLEDKTLSGLTGPKYYISLDGKIEEVDATFTKQEFLESIEESKLRKIRK